jgi:hypothetical protein
MDNSTVQTHTETHTETVTAPVHDTVRESIVKMIQNKTNELDDMKKEVVQMKQLLKLHNTELKESMKKNRKTQGTATIEPTKTQ